MKNFLNSVKVEKPGRNTFDMSHDVKLSLNMGYLTPVCCYDAVPGDKWSIGCEAMVRFAPMVAPPMHRFNVYTHYWFVPKRLLWDNYKNWRTNTKVDDVLPAFPVITLDDTNTPIGSLPDYMGLPCPMPSNGRFVTAMQFAAYQFIYNEGYRDQNLIPEVNWKLEDGDNSTNTDLLTLRRRAWEHDYFTAALPFAQKGDAVEIPIAAEVTLSGGLGPANRQLIKDASGNIIPSAQLESEAGFGALIANDGSTNPAWLDPNGSLEVRNADSSINDLRRAYALQRFLEKLARGGSRFTEFIRTVFGVKSSDARLQRPEYITGMSAPVMIGEVLNTTGTEDAPQGTMAGHGLGVASGKYGSFYCEEDGYIIGIMSVMPRTAYQQGIPKQFMKWVDPFQEYLPDFAHIGEQEVMLEEVYCDLLNDTTEVFGYMPRYAEYKYENNRVAGQFRTTLDFWHEGRIFATKPQLNQQFVECNPSHRIFAVTDPDEHKIWAHVLHKVTASRLMPKFGTPTF